MHSISYILRLVYVNINGEKFSNPLRPQHPPSFLVSDFICKEKRTKFAATLRDICTHCPKPVYPEILVPLPS